MATPEQRREVAARLRQIADAHGAVEASRVAHALGLEYEVHGTVVAFGSDAVQALADLIDPTCKPVVDDAHDMDDELVCSECGCFLAIVVDGKPSEPLYRYCPVCGARIVEEG